MIAIYMAFSICAVAAAAQPIRVVPDGGLSGEVPKGFGHKLAFDGTTAVVGTTDDRVFVLDVPARRDVAELDIGPVERLGLTAVAVTGSTLAIVADGSVQVFANRSEPWSKLRTITGSPGCTASSAAFLESGIAVGCSGPGPEPAPTEPVFLYGLASPDSVEIAPGGTLPFADRYSTLLVGSGGRLVVNLLAPTLGGYRSGFVSVYDETDSGEWVSVARLKGRPRILVWFRS